jgi:hypothetical protein
MFSTSRLGQLFVLCLFVIELFYVLILLCTVFDFDLRSLKVDLWVPVRFSADLVVLSVASFFFTLLNYFPHCANYKLVSLTTQFQPSRLLLFSSLPILLFLLSCSYLLLFSSSLFLFSLLLFLSSSSLIFSSSFLFCPSSLRKLNPRTSGRISVYGQFLKHLYLIRTDKLLCVV